jgi:hypothetical protein
MAAPNPIGTDGDFVAELRAVTAEYLAAVDAWEAAYRKYYRLAGPGCRVSSDLEEPQRVYLASRKRLAGLVPRARGLCFKHGLRDPWTGLIRTSLGQYAPQDRDEPAISRSERQSVNECLILLAEACAGFQVEAPAEGRDAESRGWLRRVVDFFY